MEEEKHCFPWEKVPIDKLDDFLIFLMGFGLVVGAWIVEDKELAKQLASALLGAATMYLKGQT